ncbi:hypothetical protein J2Y45_001593 [Dyadobacter sp. BE34]|uniref:Uncharacterized protein n=1 Tax=Dyadobacter fermentans TaxID=94254 RepID=A0ABU1QUI6_9BACT|nr:MULTISPECIES: hypothetical protein [Dyadobacter]MDR6804324.1 hypothetical protein [Dyadobacter fermentans]MDR7042064.1 hypothetical protein [Dyadobacter sp. BE242]MDR7196467.1 hypothetical protein [Dyadobacter sp. BE34]MDR7212988.1 hypothetical protein [Dyadobacter sp. BE31]MDR7261873.1 hypothetical protein [Dyadobacter sp. BE32]
MAGVLASVYMRASGKGIAKSTEQVSFQLLGSSRTSFTNRERKYNSCQINLLEVILLLFSDFTFDIETPVEKRPKITPQLSKDF